MTEKEYMLEMLCTSATKEMLNNKINHCYSKIPDWLIKFDENLVKEAIEIYDNEKYVEIRRREEGSF